MDIFFGGRQTEAKTEEAILNLRAQQPTWGARKIIRYLTDHGMKNLPVPSTVTEILKRNGFISIEESLKRQKLIRFERENRMNFGKWILKGSLNS